MREKKPTYNAWAVTPDRGFLSPKDPILRLPDTCKSIDMLGGALPELVKKGGLRETLRRLAPIGTAHLVYQEIDRARMILSFLASAYVVPPPDAKNKTAERSIPEGIAKPLWELSRVVGRPPIMSYADYALCNWKKIDPHGSITLENLEVCQTFTGLRDEAWFILVHVEIEAKAQAALSCIPALKAAVRMEDTVGLIYTLNIVSHTLQEMRTTLSRMLEQCGPGVYYHAIRPYLFSFENVIFEGVPELRGIELSMRGETGAQSSIVPTVCALLGLTHEETALTRHMRIMRDYMPPGHRHFIEMVAGEPDVRACVKKVGSKTPLVKDAYNSALAALRDFRKLHFEWARTYIHTRVKDPRGSGGTDFMQWLDRLIVETDEHLIL